MGKGASLETIGQRRSFDQLEDQCSDAVGFLQPVDRADVRVIECRERPRFAREAGAAFGIGGEVGREDLDRDVATELAVARAIDLAHAAGAERGHDRVGSELTIQHRVMHRRIRADHGGAGLEELRRTRTRTQQGLDFLPKDLIARTRLRQECVTFGQGLLQGRVVDVGDRAVSLVWLHEPRMPVANAGGVKSVTSLSSDRLVKPQGDPAWSR